MTLKDDLIRHYHRLKIYGYNNSHSDNTSVRDGSTLWVTPADFCADTLIAENLITCAQQQSPTTGVSPDAPLHLAVQNCSFELSANSVFWRNRLAHKNKSK